MDNESNNILIDFNTALLRQFLDFLYENLRHDIMLYIFLTPLPSPQCLPAVGRGRGQG
jgi:hypothetical protein